MKSYVSAQALMAVSLLILAGCQHPSRRSCPVTAEPSAAGPSPFSDGQKAGLLPDKPVHLDADSIRVFREWSHQGGEESRKGADHRHSQGLTEVVVAGLKFSEQIRSGNGSDAISQAYLFALETIIGNLSNADTIGFKRKEICFADLLDQATEPPGLTYFFDDPVLEISSAGKLSAGLVTRNFSQGDLIPTGERLDIAIKGEGFLEVRMPDGTRAYTRDGALKTATDGQITTLEGLPVLNGFQPLPSGTTSITIAPDGTVTYSGLAGTGTARLNLCRFAKPAGLLLIRGSLFRETLESGPPNMANPGTDGCGEVYQGFLEASNVRLVEEYVELVRMQRACLARARLSVAESKSGINPVLR